MHISDISILKSEDVSGSNTNVSSEYKSRLSPSRSSSSSSISDDQFIQLSSTRNITSDTSVSTSQTQQQEVMESGGFPLTTTSSNRIPSHVFATTSTTPTDWSVASNESVFSIQMGTMSFTKDQLSWMTKSGELSYNSNDSTMCSPYFEITSNQTPTRKSCEIISKKSGNMKETEAAAAETMREVLKEKEKKHKLDNISKDPRSLSQHSDASIKSFAFPM